MRHRRREMKTALRLTINTVGLLLGFLFGLLNLVILYLIYKHIGNPLVLWALWIVHAIVIFIMIEKADRIKN